MTLQTYTDFWTKLFNYKDKANRQEFWVPTVVNTIVWGILLFIAINSIEDTLWIQDDERIKIIMVTLLIIISAIPQTSLTARRFNDVEVNKLPVWICAVSLGLCILILFINVQLSMLIFIIYLIAALVNSLIACLPSKSVGRKTQ